MKQAKEIPAKCPKCNWEGYLVKCLYDIPTALLLQPGVLNEITPVCPECNEIINW